MRALWDPNALGNYTIRYTDSDEWRYRVLRDIWDALCPEYYPSSFFTDWTRP